MSQNRAYFKGWTEIDALSVVLRDADEAGMDFMGFKVTDCGNPGSPQAGAD